MIEVKMLSTLDVVSMLVAGGAAVECAVGRVGAMDRRHHRPGLMLAYFLGALVCMAAALAPLEGITAPGLQIVATAVALHLVLTLSDWRDGPPPSALRDDLAQLVPASIDSRQEGDR